MQSSTAAPNPLKFQEDPDLPELGTTGADDFDPTTQTEPQEEDDEPAAGDGAEGFPIRGGGSGAKP